MCKGVCCDHISHFWARNNPEAIRKNGYQVCCTVKSGHFSQGALSLLDRLAAHGHGSILENIIKSVSPAVSHMLQFQRDKAPAQCADDVQQWLNAKLWPPRSPELSPPYLLLCRDLKDQACAAPPIAIDDFVAINEYIRACCIPCYLAHCRLP